MTETDRALALISLASKYDAEAYGLAGQAAQLSNTALLLKAVHYLNDQHRRNTLRILEALNLLIQIRLRELDDEPVRPGKDRAAEPVTDGVLSISP